jgi:hypothetical protein
MTVIAEMVTKVDADNEGFRKGMADAVSITQDAAGKISAAINTMDQHFQSIRASITNAQSAISQFSTGIVGVLGIGALVGFISTLREGLKSIVDVAKGADAAGITTDSYQELRYAAETAGVAQKNFTGYIAEFGQQVHLAKQDAGDLTKALEDQQPAALASIKNSASLDQALLALSDAFRRAGNEQERTRIVTAAFAKTNDELVSFLRLGSQGISDAAQQARDFGFVLDESIVRKAPEIQAKFDALTAVIGTQFRNAFIDAGPGVVALTEQLVALLGMVRPLVSGMALVGQAIGAVFDQFKNDVADQQLGTLQNRLGAINNQIAELEARKTDVKPWHLYDIFIGTPEEDQAAIQRLRDERAQIELELAKRPFRASIETTGQFKGPDADKGPSAGAIRSAQNALIGIEAEFLKATQQTTAAIQLEYEKRHMALKKSLDEGLITYGDYVKAEAELEATATAKIQAEAVKRIQPLTNAISNDLSRAFDEFVRTGKLNFEDFARSMLADIAKVAFQMNVLQPLFGGGATPGGGIIGNLLAGVLHEGGMAGGGPKRSVPGYLFAMAPRFHDGGIAGLKPGEVPAILQSGERVLSRSETANSGGGGNGTIVQVINQSGGEVSQERSRQGNTDYVRILIGAVKDDMSRGGFDGVFRGRFATPVATGRR